MGNYATAVKGKAFQSASIGKEKQEETKPGMREIRFIGTAPRILPHRDASSLNSKRSSMENASPANRTANTTVHEREILNSNTKMSHIFINSNHAKLGRFKLLIDYWSRRQPVSNLQLDTQHMLRPKRQGRRPRDQPRAACKDSRKLWKPLINWGYHYLCKVPYP